MGKWRQWLGLDREDPLKAAAEALGGEYIQGTWKTGTKIRIPLVPWTLTLDVFAVRTQNTTIYYTRVRAPYVRTDGFRFKVYRKSAFSGLGKLFGMQDISVGDIRFDDHFIVKGDNVDTARNLFADDLLRDLLEAETGISLETVDNEGHFGPTFPDNADELVLVADGAVTDVERLKIFIGLMDATLQRLCAIGAALAQPTEMEL